MSRDDDEFELWMSRMQVHKLGTEDGKGQERTLIERPMKADQHGMEEFENAMRLLESVPDKDQTVVSERRERTQKRSSLNTKQRIAVAATLDLHGCTEVQATHALQRFLRHCVEDRLSPVLIVTGKGTHSPGGLSILKPAVEMVLSAHHRVRSFEEAPRPHGGRGALVVWLGTP